MSTHSSISNCHTPYTKLYQSSSESSCSMDDDQYPISRPGVVVIRGKSSKCHHSTVTREKTCDIDSNRVYDANVFDILRVDADDFATQITLMDWPVFRKIMPEELTSCSWNVKSKLEKAFNIVQFIRRFNHTNFWVQKEILHAKSNKSRIETLSLMIRVAKKLLDLNNLNGMIAVVTALLSAPIYRLQSCWNGISRRDRVAFNSLTELVSEDENRRRLRNHLATTSLPCIPFLGVYLTDLIYIDTLHPHHGGLESSQRRSQMNNICRVISEFQQSDYSFLKPLPHVQNYLTSVRYIEELQKFAEDENYRLSLSIEPPEKEAAAVVKTPKASVPFLGGGGSASGSQHKQQKHGHRKTLSEGACLLTPSSSRYNSLPPSSRQKIADKSLLDGSFPFDEAVSSHSGSSDASMKLYQWLPGVHTKKTGDKLSDEMAMKNYMSPILRSSCKNDSQCCSHAEREGFVYRKQVLRLYKKPRFCRWRRIWMAFLDHHLLFFKLRTLAMLSNGSRMPEVRGPSLRACFSREPYKCYPITGRCMIVMSEQTSENDEAAENDERNSKAVFQLNDLNRGNIYKFKTRDPEEATKWYKCLHQAIQSSRKTLEKNLMIFD